ncbi:MAG TPA: YdeI/OmpD-associated family protein [Gemmatimonadaceae bacterium]
MSDPIFFSSPSHFRHWLAQHHRSATELLVGFHKKATGKPTLTWSDSVDEALCFGWIDGVRRSLGDEAYTIRFTPRKRGSTWSLVNLRKVERLIAEGRMQPSGLAAYEARTEEKTGTYSFEQRSAASLAPEEEARFRGNRKGWAFWESQPAGYRKVATWWVVSAKRADTRERRLTTLIADSANGERVRHLRPTPRR